MPLYKIKTDGTDTQAEMIEIARTLAQISVWQIIIMQEEQY